MKIKPGDLVVSRKHPSSYLWRVAEIHNPRRDTWDKPTVTIINMGPQHPIRNPVEAAYDKRDRLGGRYTWMPDEIIPYSGHRWPDQLRLL